MPRGRLQHEDDLREDWLNVLKTIIVPACNFDWPSFCAAAATKPESFVRLLNRPGRPTTKTLLLIADTLKIPYPELKRSLLPTTSISLIESPEELARKAEKGSQLDLKRLTNLANGGVPEALTLLGLIYLLGKGVAKNVARAESLFKRAASRGNPIAMRELGILCDRGTRGEKNAEAAVRWYAKATILEDAKAPCLLAWMHLEGRGVTITDPDKCLQTAVELFCQSAARGYGNALNKLGWMHKTGHGVPCSLEKAAEHFRLAADKGNDKACSNFAVMCMNGEGVPPNNRLAAQYFLKGAKQGHPDAQYHLSKMLARGEGVKRNDREAVRWLRSAALHFNVRAERELGERYSTGRGVNVDLVFAYVWLTRAEGDGDSSVRGTICEIERRMTPSQRTLAETLPATPEDLSWDVFSQDRDSGELALDQSTA
jgi:TPR repeat protein